MAVQQEILLMTRQADLGQIARTALDADKAFMLKGSCTDLIALTTLLDRQRAAAVLVDIDPDPAGILEAMAPLMARFAETRFLVVSSEFRNDLMLEAMRNGARDFLVKSTLASDLVKALRRVVPLTATAAPPEGTLISIFSAGGGCGATTLAINLANETGLAGGRPVLLIDLDWYYGATVPYLGIDSKYGLSDVLSHNSHIDAELVRSTAVAYSDAIHVMLSPVSTGLSRAGFIRWRQLIPVLKVCQAAYPCTIIDAPRVPAHLAAAMAGVSKAVLIVFQLTVKDIHTVRSIRAAMVERGVPVGRIIPVVSRYTKRSQITLEEARTALDGSRLIVLSNDYATAIKSVNYGKPLAQTAPSTALRREIRQLAIELGSDKQGGRP